MTAHTITFEIEDGFGGGSRPLHLEIDADDFDFDATAEGIEEELCERIEEKIASLGFTSNMEEVARDIFNEIQDLIGDK